MTEPKQPTEKQLVQWRTLEAFTPDENTTGTLTSDGHLLIRTSDGRTIKAEPIHLPPCIC